MKSEVAGNLSKKSDKSTAPVQSVGSVGDEVVVTFIVSDNYARAPTIYARAPTI